MTRQIFFQIHWFLGITAGLVLAVMGVTGAMLSYENEIMAALSPGVVTIEPSDAPRLSPDEIIARASAQRHGLRVTNLTMESGADRANWLIFASPPGKKGRGESSYVDPYTGKLLGEPRGHAVFRFVTELHRWLALPGGGNGIGRQITGFSAIALVYFALSGLYLRWPRKPLDWRAWFVLDLRKSGRNLYYALHAVIGGWVLVFYLISALTGLWWSYDWYRQGVLHALTGEGSREERRGSDKPGEGAQVRLDPAWRGFLQVSGGRFDNVRVSVPAEGKPVAFRALAPGARHERMTDEYTIDGGSGKIVKIDLYANRSLGKTITTSMYEIHRGAFFGTVGRIALLLTSLTMPLFTITGLLLYIARRRKKQALRDLDLDLPMAPVSDGPSDTLVVHASQTGGAIRLARLTSAAFGNAPVVSLSQVSTDMLAGARRALFVISTYGEGEPPDSARGFAHRTMTAPTALAHLDYAVLALGDREYPEFCAFGHGVDRWLHSGGAKRMFDMIEMDGDDADAQRQWQQQIVAIGARGDLPDWAPPAYDDWRLVERRHLNPGSFGGGAYHVVLEPLGDAASDWEPGDIAEVAPRHDPARIERWLAEAGLDGTVEVDGVSLAGHLSGAILPDLTDGVPGDVAELVCGLRPLPHREYSIASIPANGGVHLLVRQVHGEDGGLGLGSGWLTAFAPVGGNIAMRLRANPNFRPPEQAGAMILIGNGTGLAGLLAHLRQRAQANAGPNWLLFGERSAALDSFHDEELQDMRAGGVLARIDRTWSRDPDCGRYVQDAVAAAAPELREWVAKGAAIYVCGSIEGMAPAVDSALRVALGDEAVESMSEHGRYKRDIY
ncbi:MAG TPA: sulfite reductase flavoprotein subunit alpha [Novosphingobium sp.]|nr:sulfite reductase flavoprotein subunit alpha [Novosphingobium sp.]